MSQLSSDIQNRAFILGLGLHCGRLGRFVISEGIWSAEYLAFYAEHSHTVEVNPIFYGRPQSPPVVYWTCLR